jgi:hypothetical protein
MTPDERIQALLEWTQWYVDRIYQLREGLRMVKIAACASGADPSDCYEEAVKALEADDHEIQAHPRFPTSEA